MSAFGLIEENGEADELRIELCAARNELAHEQRTSAALRAGREQLQSLCDRFGHDSGSVRELIGYAANFLQRIEGGPMCFPEGTFNEGELQTMQFYSAWLISESRNLRTAMERARLLHCGAMESGEAP